MADKRQHRRGYRSYPVRYGVELLDFQAQARRLSPGGFFIATNRHVFAVGTRLLIELNLKGQLFLVRGVVRHAMRVDPRFVRLTKPGMGIQLLDPSPELVAAVTESEKPGAGPAAAS